MADAETAAMLLRPFRIENLTDAYADSFGKIDNSGNRAGSGPGVVRLCPEGGPLGDPVTTVPVTNGAPGSCRT